MRKSTSTRHLMRSTGEDNQRETNAGRAGLLCLFKGRGRLERKETEHFRSLSINPVSEIYANGAIKTGEHKNGISYNTL